MQLVDSKDRFGGLLILLFAIAYLRLALDLPVDPSSVGSGFTSRTLPIGLSITAIALSLVQILTAADSRISDSVAGYRWRPAALLVLAMTLYSLTFEPLGFIVSSLLFLLAGFFILGERSGLRSVAIAAGTVATLWLLLTKGFGLYLDSGTLYRTIAAAAS